MFVWKRAIKAITPLITDFLRTQEKHLRVFPALALLYNLALDRISIFSFLLPNFVKDEVDLLDYYIYIPSHLLAFISLKLMSLKNNEEF